MTDYFTDPRNKFFTERVNPLRYTQHYSPPFTEEWRVFEPRPMVTSLLRDGSIHGLPCASCGREIVLYPVKFGERTSYLSSYLD